MARLLLRVFARRIGESVKGAGKAEGDRQLFSQEESEALARAGVYERFLKTKTK